MEHHTGGALCNETLHAHLQMESQMEGHSYIIHLVEAIHNFELRSTPEDSSGLIVQVWEVLFGLVINSRPMLVPPARCGESQISSCFELMNH